MVTKIVNAMVEHQKVYETETENYRIKRKEADSMYADRFKQQKINELYEAMNAAITSSCVAAIDKCSAAFKDIREKVNAIVAVTVPADLHDTLEVLKTIKNPSVAELEAMTSRFKNNYFAYRAILETLGGKAKGYSSITVDEVLDACAKLESTVMKCLYGSPASYMYQLIIAPNSGYTAAHNDMFKASIDGRFDEAAASVQPDATAD